MLFRVLTIGLFLAATAKAGQVQEAINEALAGLEVVASDDPYSPAIQRMYIGWDASNAATVGVAYRAIESFKPITGVVVVHKTPDGFVLHKAVFPDIAKIKNAKERMQVMTVLEQFKDVPFDPHAERSAVDGLTGATRYGIKTSGYLNYLARRIALEMEDQPAWTKPTGEK